MDQEIVALLRRLTCAVERIADRLDADGIEEIEQEWPALADDFDDEASA